MVHRVGAGIRTTNEEHEPKALSEYGQRRERTDDGRRPVSSGLSQRPAPEGDKGEGGEASFGEMREVSAQQYKRRVVEGLGKGRRCEAIHHNQREE